MKDIGTRHISDDGHVRYEITGDDLKLALHIGDDGSIFDAEYDSWDQKLIVTITPDGGTI